MNKGILLLSMMLLISAATVSAAPGSSFTDECYSSTHTDAGDLSNDFVLTNNCTDTSITWDSLNLTILGAIVDDDVVMTDTSVFVDSPVRPDLDVPATLTFNKLPFAIEPNVLVDGVECTSCNTTYYPSQSKLIVEVPGFSNYSLTGQQDFTVYSDDEPYLGKKIYQTVDLGDGNRNTEYACIVQVFARNPEQEWILAQTNPERAVQGKLFGDTDGNQPESLGYFPTKNGVANTYFRDTDIYGYMELQRVIQCTSNSSNKLVHEEEINTRYFPAGRTMSARLLWLNDGDNAFYLSFMIFGGLIVVWVVAMIYRRSIK